MSPSTTGLCLTPLLTLVLALPASAQTTKPADDTLRVLCFNIRYMNEKDGPDRWSARRDLFFDALTGGDADVIGLQEVVHAQAEEIRAKLSGYDFVGVARNDGKESGEYSPVLFRRDRFEKLDSGTFWLSESPQTIGSKGWDAQLPRIATWVKLKDRANGNREFLFLNAHLDHRGTVSRVEACKLIRKQVTELAGPLPILITGDFNAPEDGDAYAALVKPQDNVGGEAAPKLIDAYRAVHPQRDPDESTYNDFKGTRTGSRIDWVLHTPHWQPVSAEIDRMNKDGRYPSDHYPIRVTLKWANR